MFLIHGPLLCRRHHAPEQGMGLARQGSELRVELAGGEVGVVLELDQFDQATIRGSAADLVARFEKQVAVCVVEFVAVAVLRLSPFGIWSEAAISWFRAWVWGAGTPGARSIPCLRRG